MTEPPVMHTAAADENITKLEDVEWESDKLKRAHRNVTEVNGYDMEAWSLLIREAQNRWIGDVRPFFEQLVTVFPTTGRYWKIYIEQELKARNLELVEKLFQRCLIKVLNIDLWKLYLTYVKETKAMLPTYKEKMAQAYDFTLEKVGMDIQSYSIWNDYVTFLKGVEAVGSYAENQRISAVRKVYQRGVINPMTNIEQFWKDYIAFEQNINPIIAEKMGMERSRDYMNARRVAKEFEAATRGVNRNAPSVPPTVATEEVKQVELWKKYISWEKSNPLRTEDQTTITKRVMYAYEQCLLCMGHHPDIWYEAALYLELSSKLLQEKGDINAAKLFGDEAANIYERAITTILNKNMLLYFAYADFEEGRSRYEKVHNIYTRLLDIPDINPTLAYIQSMKFARRAEGIKSARTIFKKAREDPRSSFQVFASAALMEYYCSKDKNIAFRIFELGLKKFGDNPEYILNYIDYLSHLNEDNNTRVLFERVLTSSTLEPEKSVEIWNKFLEFESNVGDLTSIVKVEKRRSGVLANLKEFEDKETAQLVDRYRFLDLYPCSVAELRAIGYSQSLQGSHKGLSATGNLILDEEPSLVLPRPDFGQMIPYKPKANAHPGEHIVPGGVFPLPPSASHLCTILPPPSSFRGPFVSIDAMIEIFGKIQLPDNVPAPQNNENGSDSKFFDLAKSVHWIVDDENQSAGLIPSKKRKKGIGEDSDEEEFSGAPPVNDIYRQRQQKKVR